METWVILIWSIAVGNVEDTSDVQCGGLLFFLPSLVQICIAVLLTLASVLCDVMHKAWCQGFFVQRSLCNVHDLCLQKPLGSIVVVSCLPFWIWLIFIGIYVLVSCFVNPAVAIHCQFGSVSFAFESMAYNTSAPLAFSHTLLLPQRLPQLQVKNKSWSVSGQNPTGKSCKPYQLPANLAQCGQPSRPHKATWPMSWSLRGTDHC